MRHKLLNLLLIFVFAFSLTSAGYAQGEAPQRALPQSIADLKLETPVTIDAPDILFKLDESLVGAQGLRTVVVRLSEAPVALVQAESARFRSAQAAQMGKIDSQQAAFIKTAEGLSARIVGKARLAVNAVMLEVDASALAELAANPDVLSIRPVKDYELDLSETVPYIGATAVQSQGFTGAGIRVAVLDSGIDYLHANLGGSGNPADFTANDPTIIEAGTFPTAKVIGGYDFVGGAWTGATGTPPLAPDPDPLDAGTGGGHGTHVADIIGGAYGVAPGVSLYAVKVCSSVSTSCSGVALIQGMDFALDPNGDGDTSDHVDVINMSLGSPYGQAYDDDLSLAVENATAAGVLTVASAGNSSDKPYVTGSPAAAPSALSVAQTSVPSAKQPIMQILAPASIAGNILAVFQPWSVPPTGAIEAPVQYGDGASGNLLGCSAFPAGSLAGKIVLVDRGSCSFSVKISNIAAGGALAGVIGLVAPGDPFEGGFGGGTPTIPGYMISQADSSRIKSGLSAGVVARFDPATDIPLVMHMVGSSSRGPTMLTNIVKPEIGAPGASVSAVAGSGTGVIAFGGTSGAAPMVAGSAALLIDAYPGRAPAEIKSLLMNTAETDIMNKTALFGGYLAPISRIGGGEVRVDRALASKVAAWDSADLTGVLNFGFHDVYQENIVLKRTVTVRNYSAARVQYRVQPSFRFADDEATGAVSVIAPSVVVVKPFSTVEFPVKLIINAASLRTWGMNSGTLGANPETLTTFEYDGYISLVDTRNAKNNIHVAWHVLPRLAGDIRVKVNARDMNIRNDGAGASTVESYSLIGLSDNLPQGGPGEQAPTPDLRYLGYATFPVPAGFCSSVDSFLLSFAVNTWERQTHANAPASIRVNLDVDNNPATGAGLNGAEYQIRTADYTLNAISDGRNLAWVVNLATGSASAFFFTDHETNNGNTVMTICAEQIGMNATNFGQPINISAQTVDIYFGGPGDLITGITIAPLGERYLGVFDSTGSSAATIAAHSFDNLFVYDFGPGVNNTENGLLLLFRGGAPINNEAAAIYINP
jgi:subtilisin family serine protease